MLKACYAGSKEHLAMRCKASLPGVEGHIHWLSLALVLMSLLCLNICHKHKKMLQYHEFNLHSPFLKLFILMQSMNFRCYIQNNTCTVVIF